MYLHLTKQLMWNIGISSKWLPVLILLALIPEIRFEKVDHEDNSSSIIFIKHIIQYKIWTKNL